MPRYCAAKLCRNRGGIPSKDNKRISFYPFPLRDEARLQKWIFNMKRGEWTPSRHQYLCSEHFTEDCFDLRWGIRYLKHTAIPTIFPLCDNESRRLNNKKRPKPKIRRCHSNSQVIRSSPLTREKPLLHWKEDRGHLPTPRGPIIVNSDHQDPTVVVVRELSPDADSPAHLANEERVSLGTEMRPYESPGGEGDRGGMGETSFRTPGEAQRHACHSGSALTVVCFEKSASRSPGSNEDGDSQIFQTLPLEEDREGETEEPEDGASDEEHTSMCEHSYSRQDTDREQLWSRIASLHSKIVELDKREEKTLAKVKSVESEIDYLRTRNRVCEERQKLLEDCFASVFF